MTFRRSTIIGVVSLVAALASIARAQTPMPPPPNPVIPPDAVMQLNLYPITLFRGTPAVVMGSREKGPYIAVESIYVTRGVWDLCSEEYYYGKCIRVSSIMPEIPIDITVRSVHLVGDTGPSFVQAPISRAGPDIPILHDKARTLAEAPTPSPVVAPKIEQGGKAGDNPSLAGAPQSQGRETKFFAAPAQNGLRVLACAQEPGSNPSALCVQSAADGFCVAQSYADSAYREFEVVGDHAYLSNVLCTRGNGVTAPAVKKSGGGFKLPFIK